MLAASGITGGAPGSTIVPNGANAANYGSGPTNTITGTINGGTWISDTAANNAVQNGDLANLITQINGLPYQAFPVISGSTYTLTPGNYNNAPTSFTGVTIVFNGAGQYVINSASTLVFTSGVINLINGASASNIFWYAGSSITNANVITGTGGGLPGIFVAAVSISLNAATPVVGNLYARTGGITLFSNTINAQTLCYLKGTKIFTPNGYVAVEDLKVGDHVLSYGSIANNADIQLSETVESKPIKWISNFYARRRDSSDIPVCFKAGSLGENAPSSDLFVSPGHRVIVDGKMVLASEAVNGETIVQEDTFEIIEYYHFELDQHSVVLAEGVLSETFLELDNSKSSFQL
jgi:hypothetical protein